MGCCSSRTGGVKPLFEELILKIASQNKLNGMKCIELISEYEKRKTNSSNGVVILQSLFNPLLYPDGMPITKPEDLKVTEAFLSLEQKDEVKVGNQKIFILEYCLSFTSSSDQMMNKISEIDQVLTKENENTFNGLENFITNYLNYNLITIVDNVYAYCNKNKGIKLFGFDIDDMFMNEFDKFKQEVFTYDNISDYIIKINQIIHQEGKNKNDKVPYEVLAKLNTEKSNTLFILSELHSDFIENYIKKEK